MADSETLSKFRQRVLIDGSNRTSLKNRFFEPQRCVVRGGGGSDCLKLWTGRAMSALYWATLLPRGRCMCFLFQVVIMIVA